MTLTMTAAINANLSGVSLPISALFAGGDIPKAAALGCPLGQRDLEDSTLEYEFV